MGKNLHTVLRENNTLLLKDGRTLGYAEYGNPKGKPLFFFHGWPSCRLLSTPFQEVAESLGIRLISIDRPGFGLSTYKENRTLIDWSDDVSELADNLYIDRFSVVGVSGGGPYAAVCAYKIPKRIIKTGIVVGLAPTYIPGILDEMPFSFRFGWANYSRYPILAYLGSYYLKYCAFITMKLFGAKSDKKVIKSMAKEYERNGKEAFKQGIKGAVKDLFLYTSNWEFDLTKIINTVYLWYGEKDKNVPIAMAHYYASQIPNSKLVTYPDEGHTISLTHTEEIFKELVY